MPNSSVFTLEHVRYKFLHKEWYILCMICSRLIQVSFNCWLQTLLLQSRVVQSTQLPTFTEGLQSARSGPHPITYSLHQNIDDFWCWSWSLREAAGVLRDPFNDWGWGSVLTLNGVCFDNQSTLTTGPLAHSYAKWRKGTSLASIQFFVANVPFVSKDMLWTITYVAAQPSV